ncbi:MAG: hypothetical protein VX777_00010 [Chlamydiota bacterium]|nr:hypothetical protein [Chlamydiota bacterium]
MKLVKKLCSIVTLAAMAVSGSASADCYDDCGGCGYEECRRAPCIAPCVALGAIALAAVIAIAIQNSSCDHSHSN